MLYDTWNPYDPIENDTPESKAHLRKRLHRDQQLGAALISLRGLNTKAGAPLRPDS